VWLLDLKRAEQNRGDKGEYGEHSHHIEPQGKVHVATPFLAQNAILAERRDALLMTNILHCHNGAARSQDAWARMPMP
jgi:hypothetical protein